MGWVWLWRLRDCDLRQSLQEIYLRQTANSHTRDRRISNHAHAYWNWQCPKAIPDEMSGLRTYETRPKVIGRVLHPRLVQQGADFGRFLRWRGEWLWCIENGARWDLAQSLRGIGGRAFYLKHYEHLISDHYLRWRSILAHHKFPVFQIPLLLCDHRMLWGNSAVPKRDRLQLYYVYSERPHDCIPTILGDVPPWPVQKALVILAGGLAVIIPGSAERVWTACHWLYFCVLWTGAY